jgi:hypothetical protein
MRRLAAAIALLAAMVAMMVGDAGAATVPTAPEVVLDAGDGGSVEIVWRYRGRTQRRTTTLELERSADGAHFSPLTTVERPSKRPRRGTGVTDEAPGDGTWWYRARLLTADGTSAWGEAVSITLGDDASEPPDDEPDDPDREWPLPDGLSECPEGTVGEVLELVNDARTKAGAKPLALDPALMDAARYRAASIAIWRQLSHWGWADAIRAAGYRGGRLGENIAYGYRTPAKVMKGWLSSRGHRQNIEYVGFADVGIGCVMDARGIPWWVQSFGG